MALPHPKFILALDQGTTSSRAVLFNKEGEVVQIAQREFDQIYPNPGWVEHDPEEIWTSQLATIEEVLMKSEIDVETIMAIGLTNQRETTVVWDRENGKPVYNAIVWQDRRTADYCGKLKREGCEPIVSQKTGLRLDPYFSGTKLRWILENVEGARSKAEDGKLCFGTVDSWLLWKLTGHRVHLTDITNASRTLLYNLETDDWDDELLELFSVPRAMLPEIRSCSEIFGEVAENQILSGIPVAGVAGDQHAALFGQACFNPGMAKNTYGTGCFLLMNMGDQIVRSKNDLLTTVAWRIGERTEYALEGSIFGGGAVIQWIRDELRMVDSAEQLNEIAAKVEDANGLYIVPAFTGLGAPHWDPYARGGAFGITRGTNRAHFCRAALESIAYQSADLITAMEKDSGLSLDRLRVDGGASQSNPLMQFQADLLQTPVERPKSVETTALGAAYLAGLAIGFWPNRDALERRLRIEESFTPSCPTMAMQAKRAGWAKAVERSKNWEEPRSDEG